MFLDDRSLWNGFWCFFSFLFVLFVLVGVLFELVKLVMRDRSVQQQDSYILPLYIRALLHLCKWYEVMRAYAAL